MSPAAGRPRPGLSRKGSIQLTAFLALCGRDLWVTVRHEAPAFLTQALLQPLFFLFVFGRVLPEIGAARGSYGVELLPGIMALTLVLTALQNTALPLVIEFSFTKEIEDRLLAPLPVGAVAVQKIAIAALRGMVAGALILPLAALILPGGIHVAQANWWAVLGIFVFGVARGRRHGDGPRDRRAPQPHLDRLRGRADPADLHRLHLLPLARPRTPALVSDPHALSTRSPT